MNTTDIMATIQYVFSNTCDFIYYIHKYVDETDFIF